MTSPIPQFCYQGTKSESTQHGSAKTQPRSIPFPTKLFTPLFGCICDNSTPRLLKNHDFTYAPNLLQRHKTQPRSIPFATKLFIPHFGCICDNFPPTILKNHDFTYSPILLARHKKPIHPTWLSQKPTKIISFHNPTFHT